MATTIKLKNSVTTTNAPSSLVQGEVAINITDKKVWVGNAATTPIQLLGDGGSVNFTTVNTTNLQVTNIKAKDGTASASIANSTGAFTVAAAFAANGGATLGDASGDALTINSSAVSIPNGLNFDSNTLVIDAANNNVGIGTSSPTNFAGYTTVDAYNGTTGAFFLVRNPTKTGQFTVDTNGVRIGSRTNDFLALTTNDTERMRIDSSGNVGIGTTSPASKLDISTGSSTGTTDMITLSGLDSGSAKQTYSVIQMGIENNTASSEQGNILLQTVESGTVRTRININGSGYMAFSNGGTERMRITSAGVVQVGNNNGTGEVFAQNTVKVWGAIAAGSGTLYNSFGASSISKNSTGYFTVNFSRTLASSRFGMAGAGYAAANIIAGGNESTTSTGVRCYNDAGTLVDADIQFLIAGGS